MLTLDASLPENVLLDGARRAATRAFGEAGAHWFRADPEHLGCDAESDMGVTWLGSLTSDLRAEPSTPNHGNSRYVADGDQPGILFQPGVNCGFELPLPDGAGAAFSIALRYFAPDGDVSTLVTLNPKKGGNYLFLQRKSGVYVAKDQASTLQAEVPAQSGDGLSLVVVAFEAGQIFLQSENQRDLSQTRSEVSFDAAASLFIGCRSNRGGLQKTLGHFVLRDAILVPGRNILRDGGDPLEQALRRHHHWDT